MRHSNRDVIRTHLHVHQDGLTCSEIAAHIQVTTSSIFNALRSMPDTYIDRWTKGKFQTPPSAIWCVVIPPEDCPKPSKTRIKNATNGN